jgi:hypothetical protein
MGDALYPVRLYWAAGRGVARVYRREVRLTQPPHLPGLQVDELDYAPLTVALVMPRHELRRDMTPGEIAQARALLVRLVTAGGPAC